MATPLPLIRIGQFSESPVLAVARALDLHTRYEVDWVTERVVSSPGQFESLRSGEMDLAITSPDNVLLYATTENNPLKTQLDLRFLRPIDRGLRLALYTTEEISSVEGFHSANLGVDVMSSGFALLLLSMLSGLGVDKDSVTFTAVGATPKRLIAMQEGVVHGTVLNAETAVKAEELGLTRWATSTDVSTDYLGTVLVQMAGPVSDTTSAFLELWAAATTVIQESTASDVIEILSAHAPALATSAYVEILQSKEYGCLQGEQVTFEQLKVLADIRSASGSYTPSDEDIRRLIS